MLEKCVRSAENVRKKCVKSAKSAAAAEEEEEEEEEGDRSEEGETDQNS